MKPDALKDAEISVDLSKVEELENVTPEVYIDQNSAQNDNIWFLKMYHSVKQS